MMVKDVPFRAPEEKAPPTLQQEREQLLNLFLRSAVVLGTAAVLVLFVLSVIGLSNAPAPENFALLGVVLFAALAPVPYRWRVLLVLSGTLVFNFSGLLEVGLVGQGRMNFLFLAIVATLFLHEQEGLVTLVIGMVGVAVIGQQVSTGQLITNSVAQAALVDGSGWIAYALNFGVRLVIIGFVLIRLINNAQMTLARQRAIGESIAQEQASLEERIEERTRALRLTADVSRGLSNILDRNQLLIEVVDQIQKTFNYYHVHIYLLGEDQQTLNMAGGTGEAGKALLIGKHKLSVGQGLVGRAATTQKPVFVADVRNEPMWLPNPLLPETKAEIAVPILLGNTLIGVLDVQHNVGKTLSYENVALLQTLANQIGVALRNATIYEQVQYRAQLQRLTNEVGQKIQLTPDVNLTLQTAVRELGTALNASRTTIQIQMDKLEKIQLQHGNQPHD